MEKILVVDDEKEIRDLIEIYLKGEGYETVKAADGEEALEVLSREKDIDLIILDIMMPKMNGIEACLKIREERELPIIMLSAKAEDVDKILGLNMGADDYLPKPFNPRELLARIGAVLRRKRPDENPGAPSDDRQVFCFGEFELDLGSRTLKKNGEKVSLTTGEFAVLKAFARNARQSLSRDKLMALAKGREYEVFDRSLDVQISRLRKLIEPDPSHPQYIQTVWGIGYVFIPDSVSKD